MSDKKNGKVACYWKPSSLRQLPPFIHPSIHGTPSKHWQKPKGRTNATNIFLVKGALIHRLIHRPNWVPDAHHFSTYGLHYTPIIIATFIILFAFLLLIIFIQSCEKFVFFLFLRWKGRCDRTIDQWIGAVDAEYRSDDNNTILAVCRATDRCQGRPSVHRSSVPSSLMFLGPKKLVSYARPTQLQDSSRRSSLCYFFGWFFMYIYTYIYIYSIWVGVSIGTIGG